MTVTPTPQKNSNSTSGWSDDNEVPRIIPMKKIGRPLPTSKWSRNHYFRVEMSTMKIHLEKRTTAKIMPG